MVYMKKAFGKFFPNTVPLAREFEYRLGIKVRDVWISDFLCIQNLLDHLGRYTRSKSSREKYLRHVNQFCRWTGLIPQELTKLSSEQAQLLVQRFADELAKKDRSRAYVNTVIKRLRTFFRVNGYVRDKGLNVKRYFVPTRYRKIPEYIPTKTEIHSMADAADSRRDRAIILTIWSSGVRVSTLCALNYGDLSTELDNNEAYIMIPVYPEMKTRVPDACKGLITYYTFICPEAGQALRSYLRERYERYSKINPNDALFSSNWNLWPRDKRPEKRIGRRGIELIAKKTARLAGLEQWKFVRPHSLRKAFESVLRSESIDGSRLDKGTQEFLMGHILPGVQDTYYDKTTVEFHRQEYAKLDFSRSGMSSKTTDILIDITKLEEHLSEGWMFIARLTDQKVVVRRTKRF